MFKLRILIGLFLCLSIGIVYADSNVPKSTTITSLSNNEASPKPVQSWQDIIRQTPYWSSKGVALNLTTLRRWILLGSGYCSDKNRHILYDRRGTFLAWIENKYSVRANQQSINHTRKLLAEKSKVDYWLPGEAKKKGYPFALACDQPHVDIDAAIERLLGRAKQGRVWGTWDDLSVGSPRNKVALIELFQIIYLDRHQKGRYTFPRASLSLLLGQVIIESGVRKKARSAASAEGLMQLRPEVLSDCQVPKKLRYHRMAQIDCAYRLLQQNHKILSGPFETRFGHLPKKKRDALYLRVLLQAYHGGIGRVLALIGPDEPGEAARYFAQHQSLFSAQDIALGLIFHNLGRLQLGFASLYYATDVEIATETLCKKMRYDTKSWCQ